MPRFYANEIDITPDEFLSACSRCEINELINALVEDEYISTNAMTTKNNRHSTLEQMFEDALNALHGKWNSLTSEEEEIIMKIASRF